MAESGVHYLAKANILERIEKNASEYERVSQQLQEAVKMGDLSENSEYDAAKEASAKVRREREMLLPVLTMPIVKSNDNVAAFEEGCVVDIQVYNTTEKPLDPNSQEFSALISASKPVFYGKVMLGGTLPIMELLVDAALSVDTPIGAYLLGKQSGRYSIQVPGGFAPVVVRKLKSTEFTPDEIGCTYEGE